MRAMSKRDSIYVQLLRLLIFSAIAAGAVFLAMNMAGEIAISEYYYKSDYEGRQNRKYIERLQAYVEEQGLSSVDSEKLHSWVARQKILLLYIYKDKILIFDSSNPTEEVRQEVRDLIDTFSRPEGRFMLTMGNGSTLDWQLSSLEALYDETGKYMKKQEG